MHDDWKYRFKIWHNNRYNTVDTNGYEFLTFELETRSYVSISRAGALHSNYLSEIHVWIELVGSRITREPGRDYRLTKRALQSVFFVILWRLGEEKSERSVSVRGREAWCRHLWWACVGTQIELPRVSSRFGWNRGHSLFDRAGSDYNLCIIRGVSAFSPFSCSRFRTHDNPTKLSFFFISFKSFTSIATVRFYFIFKPHGKNLFLKNYWIVRKLRIWEKIGRFYRTLH